jgi:hypothetical protein
MATVARPARRRSAVAPAVRALTLCLLAASHGPLYGGGASSRPAPALPRPPSEDRRPPIDVVEPPPLIESDWTPLARSGLSLATLEYFVTNASPSPRWLTVTLTWNGGTTEGRTAVVDRFVVPAGGTRRRLVDRQRIPSSVQGERYPGLVQLSLAATARDSQGSDTIVLPALFVMPRTSVDFPPAAAWPHQLMDADRLEAAMREALPRDAEGGAAVSIVEWRPDRVQPPTRGVRGSTRESSREATAPQAAPPSYTTCVRWQAQTIDSGYGEDRLSWANGANRVVTAYGVRIRITSSNGSFQQTYDSSPSSGCVTWSTGAAGPFRVRVWYFVQDSNGNVIRYHDGGDAAFGSYPGETYFFEVTGYTPSPNGTTHVDAGNWSPRATAMSTASMVSRYFGGMTSDKQIHVADAVSCDGSSAHHCSGDCPYSSDTHVRLQLGSCPDSSDHRRRKFITAHELGHARAILYQEGLEPNVDTGLDSGGCNDGDSYWMESREYNSVAMREGQAHFAALWTYNDPSQSGAFIRWFNTTYDAETNTPNLSGGHLENNCGGAVDGHGSNLDAMRLYWDWTTPTTAPARASRADVLNGYKYMVDSNPEEYQYWVVFYIYASLHLSATLRDQLWSYSCWNGLIPQDVCS